VDVSNDLDWGLQLEENRLAGEYVMRCETEVHYVLLADLDVLISVSLFSVDAGLLVFFKIESFELCDDPVRHHLCGVHFDC